MDNAQLQQLLAVATAMATAAANQATALTDLGAAITQMNQNQGGGGGGVQPPPQGAAFTRSPLSFGNDPIDYNTKAGAKYHERATKPLMPKGSPFGVEPNALGTFMNRLADRAKDMGWLRAGRIGMVPQDTAIQNSPTVNIFENYGSRTLEQITAYERTIVATETRNSQDSKLLYDILMGSLSVEGQQRIANHKTSYVLVIAVGANNTPTHFAAGLCLLKVIIRESHLDSTATVSTTRLNLSSLDTYIMENGSDIVAFNEYVRTQLAILNAREETTEDLTVNLFKGYKTCRDKEFRAYILQLENDHEDDSKPLTPALLMDKAAAYYKKRLQKGDTPWETDPQEDRLDRKSTR